jgi:hypothetical protein
LEEKARGTATGFLFENTPVNLGVGKSAISTAFKSGGTSAPPGGVSNTFKYILLQFSLELWFRVP